VTILKIENDVRILGRLGLTINQARVYLALVNRGFVAAKEISEISNIAKQDVYRVIPQLQKLGLVEKLIASPNLFKANQPEEALSVLLEYKEKETSVLHNEALKLIDKLTQKTKNTTTKENAFQFSIITGKKAIIARSRKAIAEANDSICVVTPWKNSLMNKQNFLALSKLALDRKVKIRFMLHVHRTEIDAFLRNMKFLSEDSRFDARLLFAGEPISFSVFDKEQVFFSTQKDVLGNAPILWSNNPNFAALAKNYFDILWEAALILDTPAEKIISKSCAG
jgi:sugar-specific transcriptional regulator TrmB